MFKNIFVDKTTVLSCTAMAVLIALLVLGTVPFSALASHLPAYVGAAILVGATATITWMVICDRVIFPIVDRFLNWAEAKRHCKCCVHKQPKRASLAVGPRNSAL